MRNFGLNIAVEYRICRICACVYPGTRQYCIGGKRTIRLRILLEILIQRAATNIIKIATNQTIVVCRYIVGWLPENGVDIRGTGYNWTTMVRKYRTGSAGISRSIRIRTKRSRDMGTATAQ